MKKIPDKWKFAIGHTSRVPNSGGLHYLIVDFDTEKPDFSFIRKLAINNAIIQRTKHGWHVYTDLQLEFDTVVNVLKNMIDADPVWIRIGQKRGYYFLADKQAIIFPWPVEPMVIYIGKEKTQDSTAPGLSFRKKGN